MPGRSFSQAATSAFCRFSISLKRAWSSAIFSRPPRIFSVTSVTARVTNTRADGPLFFSSARVFARKPSLRRFASFVLLCWSAPVAQWWFVAIRPSGEMNDAEHPPRLTIAESVPDVGSDSDAGSIVMPSSFSFAAWSFIWCGIHMPPGFSNLGAGATYAGFASGCVGEEGGGAGGGGGCGGGVSPS